MTAAFPEMKAAPSLLTGPFFLLVQEESQSDCLMSSSYLYDSND